ncbi:hypothetical protein TSUD_275090 [Trifolium subterraneum]|uniref:Endonuclease/exonuclease/phosphatase domain-containing protein n=1 Tax=Trifolium subterraneum TaxID=3900 RepID=A0A2Z6N479_TRISU|nr:hypothetical protein TSUD_275090 [Trifolium subterraneum]
MSRPVSSEEAASSASVNKVMLRWRRMMSGRSDAGRRVWSMKIVSWNVRGLGGLGKRQEVRKLVENHNPSLLCIQETKLQLVDPVVCSSLWGNSSFAFSYRPSIGASGGLLTLWDSSEVDVWASESHDFVLWCHGRFLKSGEEFSVANVYVPCDPGAKQQLWDSLSVRIQALRSFRVCVCGDFNAVRSIEERRSGRGRPSSLDHLSFNRFIEDKSLIDLPLSGRKFTWFKGDGLSMSRLDRFLLSGEWCLTWPNCTQVARLRGLSDHCPLILAANEEDWGHRPSRMLKCWKDVPGYNIFMKDKWNSFQTNKSVSVADMFQSGWGVGGETWVWRRQLRAWEDEMLGEFQTLLFTISLQAHSSDRWLWQPDLDSGYSVRSAYQLMTHRLLRDRLPTKANLTSRGILLVGDIHCVSGCGSVESAHHVFISCSMFGSLWSLVSSWVGSAPVTAQTLSDHFVQFTSSAGGTRARRSFMQLIWLACMWVVWTERNHRLFRGSATSSLHMLDKIKTFSFRWLTAKSCTFALNYHSWWSSPMLCLGLV